MRSIIFFLALSLMGCSPPRVETVVKVIDSEEVSWIVLDHMAKYKHAQGRRLRLEHSQVRYTDSITSLHLEISSQEILEVDEARNLLVDFVEGLLRSINTNPAISNQLAVVPFSADQLDIEINFESFFGIYIDPFYVGCVKLKDGMARYNAFDLKEEGRYSWHSRVEPYFKTRELSMLSRGAEKKWDDENLCPPPHIPEELYLPDSERGCYKPRLM